MNRDQLIEAVRFVDQLGSDIPEVGDMARPEPGPDEVLVEVRAAAISPNEPKILQGP